MCFEIFQPKKRKVINILDLKTRLYFSEYKQYNKEIFWSNLVPVFFLLI